MTFRIMATARQSCSRGLTAFVSVRQSLLLLNPTERFLTEQSINHHAFQSLRLVERPGPPTPTPVRSSKRKPHHGDNTTPSRSARRSRASPASAEAEVNAIFFFFFSCKCERLFAVTDPPRGLLSAAVMTFVQNVFVRGLRYFTPQSRLHRLSQCNVWSSM